VTGGIDESKRLRVEFTATKSANFMQNGTNASKVERVPIPLKAKMISTE
jgi:hypothetical protein